MPPSLDGNPSPSQPLDCDKEPIALVAPRSIGSRSVAYCRQFSLALGQFGPKSD